MFSDISSTSAIRMNGWNHTSDFCKQKISNGQMIHLLSETTNVCDQDCEYCYTVLLNLDIPHFHSKPLPGELVLEERLELIDEASKLGAVSYDIVGAGEPLLDPYFFRQVEHAVMRGMVPVIFTNGSILGDPNNEKKALIFANRLKDVGATVVVKWHSSDNLLHDSIVRRKHAGLKKDIAIQRLKNLGFNKESPTRLGVDNIIYQKTLAEIPGCLRMCRRENIFLVCSTFIPAGRTQKGNEVAASWKDITTVFEECRKIDESEFGIIHSSSMPYVGFGKTCTQYMGLYVNIQGYGYGCVGMSESYGNVRARSLREMWLERAVFLQKYDGGCPPRQRFYEMLVEFDESKKHFK